MYCELKQDVAFEAVIATMNQPYIYFSNLRITVSSLREGISEKLWHVMQQPQGSLGILKYLKTQAPLPSTLPSWVAEQYFQLVLLKEQKIV